MSQIIRRKTPTVLIGNLMMGGGHPIVVQSMTDTSTADDEETYAQTLLLIGAGAELVRWTVNDVPAALGAVKAIKRLRASGVLTPIAGDFHFNGHELLTKYPELASLLDKYRVNPGNVGGAGLGDENFSRIIHLAVKYGKAVRVGVNWGSLDKGILAKMMDDNKRSQQPKPLKEIMYEAVIQSALDSCSSALKLGLSKEKLVLSAKLSVVQDMVEVYRRLAKMTDIVLHVGLTEAGGGVKGIAASSIALGILLEEGIGDTIRVSLTPEPGACRSKEVEVCREILQVMDLRYFSPSITSCPGCGRTNSRYFQVLAQDIQQYVVERMPEWLKLYPGIERLKIAVMGCVVNGPGESQHADIGISLPGSFEEPVAPVYVDGQKHSVLKGEKIKEEFIAILEEYITYKYPKN